MDYSKRFETAKKRASGCKSCRNKRPKTLLCNFEVSQKALAFFGSFEYVIFLKKPGSLTEVIEAKIVSYDPSQSLGQRTDFLEECL